MPSALPINIRDLLHVRGIEQERVEFKSSWNDGPTAEQVVRTLCAFANDYHNINGGYVVLGVEDAHGMAKLPPAGLHPEELEAIQQRLRVLCKTKIDPEYQPLMSPEVVDGRHILVLWAPGSDNRPLRAPDRRNAERVYYIRLGADSVKAEGIHLTALMQMTAKVPFDDRRASSFRLADLRASLVRELLHDVGSGLIHEPDDAEVYRRMRLTAPINGHEVPRNVALLLFSDDPERAFPGARIEVAQFADDTGGDVIEEKIFRGPLVRQLRDCIGYLRNFTTLHIQKVDDRADARGWVSYPLPALEEAIVNAVYHRSYEATPEPTKVYLYPDRIDVTSYPGPVPGLSPKDLDTGAPVPPVPARNRRIGEYLIEFAQSKSRLARRMSGHTQVERQARLKLYREARDMLRRVLQLDSSPIRHAWTWYELGHVLRHLQAPRFEVEEAFRNACTLAPEDERFSKALERQQSRPERGRRGKRSGPG